MADFEIIYETRGKAKEYAPLGVELYTGCRLGCRYCFVPKLRNITIEQFHKDARPVDNAISKLESDAKRLKTRQDDREILLCFESDPYQFSKNEKQHITREAIEILKEYGLRFTILTKAGFRGTYDFDLLKGYKKASFGTTIIFTDQGDAKKWEPDAANINFRIKAIEMAREKDIKTWVSIEPVIDPNQALQLIEKYHPIVDHWKIGKINYHREIEAKVDWIRFREEVKSLLDSLGADYYLKKSLTDLSGPEPQKKDIKMATKTGTPIVEGKITKPEFPLSENDIKIIPGNKRILLIAPHGVMGDDDNTDILTFEVRKRLECYAIVNDVYQRDSMNFNSFASASSHPEFIKTIKKVVETPGYTLVVWIHGIENANANKEAKAKDSDFNGEPKDLHALIGYGQGPNPIVPPKARTDEDEKSSPTARKKMAEAFRDLLINKGMPTILTRDKAKKYRGREPDNMNQWFLNEGYDFDQVESLQLEIRMIPTRLKKNIVETAEIIANTLSEFIPLVEEVAEAIDEPLAESITVPEVLDEVEDKVDDVLVDSAYQWLMDRFRQHMANFVLEAGQYIIDTFYGGNPRAAFAKNKTKEQPPSLKRLIEKIRQSSKSPSEDAPSIGWLYNAVNLAAHEAICEQEGLQTFGILGHSHKLQLLHVPKLKQIEKNKFDEAIRPAFEEKERLAGEAVEKNLSVREFKAYINEQYPDDSDTIDLTDMPPLEKLRQRESKELLRLLNSAKRKVDEGRKMIGIYSNAIQTLDIVLAEKGAKQKRANKKFKGWEKVNLKIKDGLEKEATAPIIISASRATDLPAFYSDWFMERLRQGYLVKRYPRNPKKIEHISFSNTQLIVFWTKNPEPMFKYLDEIEQMGIGYYFQYTLNDYEGDGLETNVPPLKERIDSFKTLSKRIGKERVIWRFDPLILTDVITREKLAEKVRGIMTQLSGFTEKLVISFMKADNHKKVVRNLNKAGIKYRDFSKDDIDYLASYLAKMGKEFGVEVAACAEENDLSLYGIAPNKCIDDGLIRRVFSHDDALMEFIGDGQGLMDMGQRKKCRCIVSKDIGEYHTCQHLCIYCYANVSEKIVSRNVKMITQTGEMLLPPLEKSEELAN